MLIKRLVKIKLKSIFSNIVSGVTVGREKTSFSSYTIIFFVCVKLHHILINPLLPVMWQSTEVVGNWF